MSLDRGLETYREIYRHTDDRTTNEIDSLFDDLQSSMYGLGYKTAQDDRAENLLTAIVKYLVESGNAI